MRSGNSGRRRTHRARREGPAAPPRSARKEGSSRKAIWLGSDGAPSIGLPDRTRLPSLPPHSCRTFPNVPQHRPADSPTGKEFMKCIRQRPCRSGSDFVVAAFQVRAGVEAWPRSDNRKVGRPAVPQATSRQPARALSSIHGQGEWRRRVPGAAGQSCLPGNRRAGRRSGSGRHG